MLNSRLLGRHRLREELRLRCWQFVLWLTRLATGAHHWAQIFKENRRLMALAFFGGILIGLIPLIR